MRPPLSGGLDSVGWTQSLPLPCPVRPFSPEAAARWPWSWVSDVLSDLVPAISGCRLPPGSRAPSVGAAGAALGSEWGRGAKRGLIVMETTRPRTGLHTCAGTQTHMCHTRVWTGPPSPITGCECAWAHGDGPSLSGQRVKVAEQLVVLTRKARGQAGAGSSARGTVGLSPVSSKQPRGPGVTRVRVASSTSTPMHRVSP